MRASLSACQAESIEEPIRPSKDHGRRSISSGRRRNMNRDISYLVQSITRNDEKLWGTISHELDG